MNRQPRHDPYRRAGTSLDRYYISEIVGVGGMGAVYRAQHEITKVDVAIKILKPDLAFNSQQAVDLFISEAARTAGLNHPNIVRVMDAGIYADERLAYIAMEWLEGHTLADELRERGRLPVERVAALLAQVCEAVEYAHERNIVHRDLKPANIMVVSDYRGREAVKILDFGIAKGLDSTMGVNSRVIGAPYYASPEQLSVGANIDGRSDIYSLGVTAYQLLTGELPFEADSLERLIRMHLKTAPRPLREVCPDLPEAVGEVVLRTLAKSPKKRYASATALARAFREAANLQPGAITLRCTDAATGAALANASVYVNGLYDGATNEHGAWANRSLSPGEYLLEVSFPGYLTLKQAVGLRQREERRLVANLEASQVGDLTIDAGVASAQVALDGQNMGATDSSGCLELDGLRTGTVKVEISHPKYQTFASEVRVLASRPAYLNANMVKHPRRRPLIEFGRRLGRALRRSATALKLFAQGLRPSWPRAAWASTLQWQRISVLIGLGVIGLGVAAAGWWLWESRRGRDIQGLRPTPTPAVAETPAAREQRSAAEAAALNQEGLALYRQNKFSDAEQKYQRATELDGTNDEYFFHYGLAILSQRRYAEAIKPLAQAVKLNGKVPSYHNGLGYAYWMTDQRSAEAEREFREAIKLAPENPMFHNNVGKVLLAREDYGGALAEFEKAVSLRPSVKEYKENAARAKQLAGSEPISKAP